jgi:hypothetical protein
MISRDERCCFRKRLAVAQRDQRAKRGQLAGRAELVQPGELAKLPPPVLLFKLLGQIKTGAT